VGISVSGTVGKLVGIIGRFTIGDAVGVIVGHSVGCILNALVDGIIHDIERGIAGAELGVLRHISL
jgi:large-conductance mechanosensitive channel